MDPLFVQIGKDNKLLDSLYCPTCKSKLNRYHLMDIFLQGLICENGHRFFVELFIPTGQATAQCSDMIGPNAQTDYLETIKLWLTKTEFRSKLNGQLAVMIRRIYEICDENIHISIKPFPFQFCPLCLNKLEEFKQNDAWVRGLKCSNGHDFFERNGIGFSFEGHHLKLVEEMRDEILDSHIDGWLKDYFDRQRPEQIKNILQWYKNRTS